jgi:hypothetical protein
MKDFYFIFHPVGPQFINTMLVTFKYIPKDCNVVVMTPTPQLLKDIVVDFNLIVLDTEDLIDDFTRRTDNVIKETDHDKYMEILQKNLKENKRFCDITNRWIMPWLVKNNITRFALVNADSLINFDGELQEQFDYMNNTYEGKNVMFGPIMSHFYDKQAYITKYGHIFDKHGIPKELILELPETLKAFDGWMRGFLFDSTDLVQLYFNIWDDIIKHGYETDSDDLKQNPWTVTDEGLTALIAEMISLKHDVLIEDIVFNSRRLVKHIYHPENDYFGLHHDFLYSNMYKLQRASSRQEFYEVNKDTLVNFYGNQNGIPAERVHEVIYDLNK